MILHNRHHNLDRLLDYYANSSFTILIADSSKEKHVFKQKKDNWIHYYTPGLSFTQKIEFITGKVETDFVAMCADDDFIIPEALEQSAAFLDQNADYAIAQGWSIRYHKESLTTKDIRYSLLYNFSSSIEATNALERLTSMFSNYRSVLYAVFRTEVLRQSFEGAGKKVANLFLNEYITAFLPILSGKYKELPILYQVREYAEDSDDKTATNIDTMLYESQFSKDLLAFESYISNKLALMAKLDYDTALIKVKQIIQSFSATLELNRVEKTTLKKRVGKIVNAIPFFGNKFIGISRKKETEKQLHFLFENQQNKEELDKISCVLLTHLH